MAVLSPKPLAPVLNRELSWHTWTSDQHKEWIVYLQKYLLPQGIKKG